ncbi:MAG TPA: PAS domain S-box protein [Methylomirabilota bacterium]|jgi:PAS domain S-box-containing protein
MIEPTPEDIERARLAAIVDSSDDAIVSKTLDGVITSWNRAAERMFGYTSEEAVGRHITLIIPVERHAEEDDVLARIRRGQIVDHFETVRQRKDGTRLSISLSVSPIRDATGRIIGASKIARDVTERKRIEAERDLLLEEAQEANRAKDDFLAMFGHELRNPLAAIASAADVIDIARGPDDIRLARDVIRRQVIHLKRLVDDLLDAARVRTGKIVLERRAVNLAEAVQQALSVVRGGVAGHRHVIETQLDDVGVDADPVRLDQIILNIVTNAMKYTPAGRAIRVLTFAEGNRGVLRVEDEGVGIARETLPRIFGLFVQGERTLDRAQGGLGIGLTLVRTLVELHGGTVTADSPGPGLGSVFTVSLPRIELPSTIEGAPARPPAIRRRVLIVEDNDDARQMLRILLEHEGHEVFEAIDGTEGVRAASRVRPDLALIDLGLPILDGYEVARFIRRQDHQPQRLVALTGYGQPEDRERALRAGFDDHLVKPVDPDRLAELLQHLR